MEKSGVFLTLFFEQEITLGTPDRVGESMLPYGESQINTNFHTQLKLVIQVSSQIKL